MNNKLVFALFMIAACSTSTAPTPARTSVDGTFARYTTSPRGDVDGVVLQDGTVAHFPPHSFVGANISLSPGDKLHVEGDLMAGGSERRLGRVLVKKGDTVIALDEGPSAPPGGKLAPPPPRSDLPEVTRDGTVARVLINPHGETDGLLLQDGTVLRFHPTSSINVAVGQTIHVTGRGREKLVEADAILPSSGTVLRLAPGAPPAIPPAPLTTVSEANVVEQVLTNAEKEPDLLILKNGTLVRLPPSLREGASDLFKPGASIQIEGEGGTYDGTKSVHARRIVIAGRELVDRGPLGGPPPAPPAPPPPAP